MKFIKNINFLFLYPYICREININLRYEKDILVQIDWRRYRR